MKTVAHLEDARLAREDREEAIAAGRHRTRCPFCDRPVYVRLAPVARRIETGEAKCSYCGVEFSVLVCDAA